MNKFIVVLQIILTLTTILLMFYTSYVACLSDDNDIKVVVISITCIMTLTGLKLIKYLLESYSNLK